MSLISEQAALRPVTRFPSFRLTPIRGTATRVAALALVYLGLIPQALLRGGADDVGFPRWQLDRADSLFGLGTLPSALLQGSLSEVGAGRTPVDWLAIIVYVAWLPVGLFTMWYVIRGRWHAYRGFALTWYGIWYLGLIAFVLVPVEPPWMLADVERTLGERMTGFVDIDPNQVAAFPSLHVGMPAALALHARAVGWHRSSIALGVFAALTAFSVVHLGEHYVIDVIGGVALAWLVVHLVSRFAGSSTAAETAGDEADRERRPAAA